MLKTLVMMVSLTAGFAWAAGPEANLLKNPDFAQKTDAGAPAEWKGIKGQKVTIDTNQLPPGVAQALRVEITEDGGGSYGQAYQTLKARPGTIYRLEGKLRSTKPGLGFMSIKLIKGGHEAKRFALFKSPDKWETLSQEFSSEDADEIQVLCRWEQNAKRGWVGQTCWFAELKLVEKGAAPAPPAWTTAIRKAASVQPVTAPELPLKPAEGDLFITPDGAGRRDGTSFDHALPGNAPGVLQAAWDALAPGKTCRVASGIYVNVSLSINSGGTSNDQRKRLLGEDTGGGLPWFVGNWDPANVEKGSTFLSLANQASHCTFENLQVARYQNAVASRKGGHVGLIIRNVDVYESRFGLYLNGGAYADAPDTATHDLTIQDCEFIHFPKSAIRLQGGNYDVRVINCVADTGGVEWMKESFQICFNVQGDHSRRQNAKDDKPWASEHDILFINCVARNAVWSKARYWQGDGFLAEGDIKNIAFINCSSFDNADGGWDCKASNAVYVNCVSLRNKMNYRVWQHGFFYNCLSAYAFKHGGSWTGAGVWTKGGLHADRSTFHNNESRNISYDIAKDTSAGQGETPRVVLERSIVSWDGMNSKTEALFSAETSIGKTNLAEWRGGPGGAGADPEFVAADKSKLWLGTPADAFDSRKFGASQGYSSRIAHAWSKKPVDELVAAGRELLKSSGWEDYKKRVEKLTGQ